MKFSSYITSHLRSLRIKSIIFLPHSLCKVQNFNLWVSIFNMMENQLKQFETVWKFFLLCWIIQGRLNDRVEYIVTGWEKRCMCHGPWACITESFTWVISKVWCDTHVQATIHLCRMQPSTNPYLDFHFDTWVLSKLTYSSLLNT